VGVETVRWVVVAYILPFGLGLVGAGRLADAVGHRRVFRWGLAATAGAVLACGLASTLAGLLAARVAQGVAAALVAGSAPALVTLAAPAAARGRALGWFGFGGTLGMVAGPLLGGVLVATWGWPAVFLARVPLVLALAWAAGRPGWLPGRERAPAPAAAAGGRAAAGAALALASLVHLLAQAAHFSVWLLVPYYLAGPRDLAAGPAGLLFAAGPAAWALASPLAGRLVDRGGGRRLAPAGLALEALGLWLVAGLGGASPPAAIAGALAVTGAGLGLFVVANTHDVMSALPRARQGVAGGLVMLVRNAGIVGGALAASAVHAARQAAHAGQGLPPAAAAAAAFGDTFRVMAAVAAAAALVALALPSAARRPAA
jgi:MFS family permease